MKTIEYTNTENKDIILLTVCNDISKANILIDSAIKNKWNLKVLIPSEQKWHNTIKIKTVNQYLSESDNSSNFIFFVDAYDVVIQDIPENAIKVIKNVYKKYKKKIIIEDDSYYRTPNFLKNVYHFPRPNKEWGNYDLSEKNFIYKHNTGLILAFKKEFQELYENILKKTEFHNLKFKSDQKLFGKIYTLYPEIFNYVYKSRDGFLHHTGYFPNTIDLFDKNINKFILKNGNVPIAIHTNGKENNEYRLQQFNHINNKLNNSKCFKNCVFCKKTQKRFLFEIFITITSIIQHLIKGKLI